MHDSFALQNFEVKADDLEQIEELGRGAYGVVEKMRHVPSGVIMAVKVGRELDGHRHIKVHAGGSGIGARGLPARCEP